MRNIGVGLAILTLGCGAGAEDLRIVASILPVADMARQIGGDLTHVDVLLPSGASPHTFDPTAREMRVLSEADAFLAVGLGLERWVDDLIDATCGSEKRFVVSDGVPLLGGDPPNPHVWLDPVRARMMASNMAAVYRSLSPENADVIDAREHEFLAELDSLHAWIRSLLGELEERRFVAFHPAWVYFADRYGLEQVAVIEEFPGKEPSPRYLARLVDSIRGLGVRALFTEPQLNDRSAEALARETGMRIAVVDPLGSQWIPGRNSYIGLMRWNTAIIVRALSSESR